MLHQISKRLIWLLFIYTPKLFAKIFTGRYDLALPHHDGTLDAVNVMELIAEEHFEIPDLPKGYDIGSVWNPPRHCTQLTIANVHLGKVEKALIFPEGFFVSELGISSRQMAYPSEELTLNAFHVTSKRLNAKRITKLHHALLIHERWSYNNYYHWMVECLPKYVLWLEQSYDPSVPVIVPEDASSFVVESIRLLRPNQTIVLLPQDEQVFAENCYFIDHLRVNPRLTQIMVSLLLSRLSNEAGQSEQPKRIYISRRHATARRIVNETELIAMLFEFGIEAVAFEELAFVQQVSLCRAATLIIGTHGAGLTNCVFMPAGAAVVEITTAENLGPPIDRYCYYTLLNSTTTSYYPFLAEPLELNNVQTDLTVNISQLHDLLSKMLTDE
jgi:capsular polysaccharide biosynthesis protein